MVYAATPKIVHTPTYAARNIIVAATDRRRDRTWERTPGTAPGSIIAAIILAQTPTKNPNEPSVVSTPMSMPRIRVTATAKQAAATPNVMATERVRTPYE